MIIAKAGNPVARLAPIRKERKRRRLAPLAGRFSVPADFDAPLPQETLAGFEGPGNVSAR